MESPLRNAISKNLPYVIYRFPGEEKIHVLIQKNSDLRFRSFTEIDQIKGFFVAPFRGKTINQLICLNPDHHFYFTEKKDKLIDFVGSRKISTSDQFTAVSGITKEEYIESAEFIIQALKEGYVRKVVLSRVLEVALNRGFNWATFLFVLMETYKKAFVYYLSLPGFGNWIGATPEILLSKESDYAETVSLAGTKDAENYKWTEKEKKEQQIVSDYIEESLFKNDIRDYKRNGPFTVSAGNVVHLKTQYILPLDQLQSKVGSLVADLHPTPAVCGLPRNKAYELISKIEKHDRDLYAGFLGPWNFPGQSKLFVNLRCAEIGQEKINLFIGGGLTAESIPEDEWKETIRKSRTLLSVLEKM